MPGQAQALCQPGLISQIDFDLVRIAATAGDVSPGNVVHLFQSRRTFGQGHQFLLKLCRINGVRVGLGGEHIDAHVVEQLCAGIGTVHGGDCHGEQLFPQAGVDMHGIKHAPDPF
ncbi:hypothetical protein D3C84_885030 [compost metagenome]